MSECPRKHKICDSHLRSFLTVFTGNAVEVVIDYFIFNLFLHYPAESFGFAVATQIVCYSCTYLSLRIWNRIKWGRKVIAL
jgi:hypothetical protein